jgi:hypothetical protein
MRCRCFAIGTQTAAGSAPGFAPEPPPCIPSNHFSALDTEPPLPLLLCCVRSGCPFLQLGSWGCPFGQLLGARWAAAPWLLSVLVLDLALLLPRRQSISSSWVTAAPISSPPSCAPWQATLCEQEQVLFLGTLRMSCVQSWAAIINMKEQAESTLCTSNQDQRP